MPSLAHGWVRRWGAAACIGLALVLLAPCITTGFVADDLVHKAMLSGAPGMPALARHPLDLFRFASGDPTAARALVDSGVFPWWTEPNVRLSFFRPLASFTHWLDYRLWPDSALAMHLHSLLWYALLLTVVAALYRRFARPGSAAVLPLLLFAIDDAHAPAVGWIANRNALIALTLSLPALALHDRARREGGRSARPLAALVLLAGLCAGEAALVTLAYLVAYAVFLDRGRWTARLGALWPYAAVMVGWRAACAALGYGVSGSGLYVDPITAPLAFARATFERLPVLVLGELALPWADLWEVYPLAVPVLRPLVFLLALAVTAGFFAVAWPLLRESGRARFWALGSVLALLPTCATFPHDRLLLGAGIGAMAVVAELLLPVVVEFRGAWRRRAVYALGVVHIVLAALLSPIRASHVGDLSRPLKTAADTLAAVPDVARRSVVLVNPPIDPFAAYLPVYLEADGRPRPQRLLWLATGVSELTLTVIDERTVRVHAKDGFLSSSSQCLLRDPRRSPALGEHIELSLARIQVVRLTADRRPMEIDVEFREPIRSDELVWMQWDGAGYAPFAVPSQGASTVVPRVNVASALFG